MQQRTARFQTVVTAVLANRHGIDGLEVVVQEPKALKEEMAYLEATSKAGSVLGSSQRGVCCPTPDYAVLRIFGGWATNPKL